MKSQFFDMSVHDLVLSFDWNFFLTLATVLANEVLQ